MKIPGYWARREFVFTASNGFPFTRSALGWSFTSQSDADQMALDRAERFAKSALDGGTGEGYYSGTPLHEPVLRELSVDGESVALVTRNRYGCRVLNTNRVLFADIDLVPLVQRRSMKSLNPAGALMRILGLCRAKRPPVSLEPSTENIALARIADWHAQTGTAVRVYRTFAGLRLITVDRQYDATDPDAIDILRTLKSDPLYVQLTRRQECFRARLSPKPWRMGVTTPAYQSHIDHPDYTFKLAKWAEPYERKASNFATCRLLKTFGEPATDKLILATIELHDASSLNGEQPLA